MKLVLPLLVTVPLGCSSVPQAQQKNSIPVPQAQRANSVLLPESQAWPSSYTCSRDNTSKKPFVWTPTLEDIRKMESRFDQIVKLASESKQKTFKITDETTLQYLGIVECDKKFIYVNAFPTSYVKSLDRDRGKDFWKTQLLDVSDGGPSFWNVVYDIETEEFSHLMFNGEA